MRVVIAAVLCLAGCDQVLGLDRPGPGLVLEGFTHRKTIRIISEARTELTNFPVALILDDDPDLTMNVQDGRDFAVTDADGKVLDIELERFDLAQGDLVLWARVPTLAAQGETVVYLYFGGEAQAVDRSSTWPDGYAAVWHLAGTAVEMDSTRSRVALIPDTSVPAADVGIAAGARGFDGSANRMQALDVDALDAGLESFSNSLWVFARRSGVSGSDMPLNKGGASVTQPGYDYELGAGDWQAQVADGDTRIILELGTESLNGAWHHLATVVDREAGFARAYLDGRMITEAALVDFGSMSNDSLVRVGGHVPFDGRIDEVRLYHGALSADWIATEHRNLATPTSFLLVSDADVLR